MVDTGKDSRILYVFIHLFCFSNEHEKFLSVPLHHLFLYMFYGKHRTAIRWEQKLSKICLGRSNVQINQLVNDNIQVITKLVLQFGYLPLFGVENKSEWIQSYFCARGAGSLSTTRCFDSLLQGSHSMILNAMTHDFVPDALDRCTLGDLCLRHLPGPQEQISTAFFLLSWKQMGGSNFFILGASTNGARKDANTPDREHFSPTKCLISEKV